jgi:hypothetical protein
MEGNNRGSLQGTVSGFARINCRKPRKISVRTTGTQATFEYNAPQIKVKGLLVHKHTQILD